jgi:hypothetical protein
VKLLVDTNRLSDALEHGLVLYTRDEHFESVPGWLCV